MGCLLKEMCGGGVGSERLAEMVVNECEKDKTCNPSIVDDGAWSVVAYSE